MIDWRHELQQQLNINNEMRAQSVRRIGDSITETPPCTEGAGRTRERSRCQQESQ